MHKTGTYTHITWIEHNDVDLEYHCTYEPAEPETYDYPGTDITVDIKKVLMDLPDKDGNMVTVDVLSILEFDIDFEHVLETIREEIREDEPDPDAGRDDY